MRTIIKKICIFFTEIIPLWIKQSIGDQSFFLKGNSKLKQVKIVLGFLFVDLQSYYFVLPAGWAVQQEICILHWGRMVIGSSPLCQNAPPLIPSLFWTYRLGFPTYWESGPVSDNVCWNVYEAVPEVHLFSGFITGFSQQRICWHTLPSSPPEQFPRARWSPPHGHGHGHGHGHDLPSWQCQCCERWTPHCRLHPSPIHLHLVKRSKIRAAVNNEFLQAWQNGEYTKST